LVYRKATKGGNGDEARPWLGARRTLRDKVAPSLAGKARRLRHAARQHRDVLPAGRGRGVHFEPGAGHHHGQRPRLGPTWLFLIAAEAIAATEGLGYRIFLVRRFLAMDIILPYVAWITLLAFVLDALLARLSRRLYPWAGG
jgi:hypothetical protein